MSQTHIPAALRRLVRERAAGRCEYCLDPESATLWVHWIDHGIAEKHGGATEETNLALCCSLCNRYKGTDLASIDFDTGSLVAVYHPRRELWASHFRIAGGVIEPLTATGRVTVRLLRMNDAPRVQKRGLLVLAGEISAPTN